MALPRRVIPVHLSRILVVWAVLCAQMLYPAAPTQAAEPRQTLIVTLRTAVATETFRRTDLATRRFLVADAQTAMLRRQPALLPQLVRRLQTLPVLVVALTDAEAAAVAADPAVAAIRPSRLYAPALDASTHIIGAQVTGAAGDAGAGASVAVLDTGVASTHPMLSGRVVAEACFSTNDAGYAGTSLCPDAATASTARGSAAPCTGLDACNHGTHVASIIAGKPTVVDGARLSGVAPAAKIIAVQVFTRFDHTNPNRVCGAAATEDCVLAFESDILAALDYLAVSHGSPGWGTLAAVNLSLSAVPTASDCDADTVDGMGLYKTYVDTLRGLGIATVVAAGNEGSTTGVGHPACISSAISVGSTQTAKAGWDAVDSVSSFSNAPAAAANLPNAVGDRLLDLLAPGGSIMAAKALPANSYGSYSGTSMAAPHVAGAWAVLKGLAPTLGVTQALTLLRETGEVVTDTRAGVALAVPRIALDRAVARLKAPNIPVALVPLGIEFGLVQQGSSVSRRITLRYSGTTVRLSRSSVAAPWSVTSSGCPLVIDDIQTTCFYDIRFAPTPDTSPGWYGAALTVNLNGVTTKIGLSAQVVVDPPAPGLTQTILAAPTAAAALTRSLTPTATVTPLAHTLAQTLIADTTRTMRRRETGTAVRAATRTSAEVLYQTALATGAASRTPTQIPTTTPTASALPVTKTIARAVTQTALRRAALTETPRSAATHRAVLTQTARADELTQTAADAAGSPSRTPTRTATRTRWTATASRTSTRTPAPSLTPSVAVLTAVSARTNARYHGIVVRNAGAQALLIHTGDRTKSDLPLVTGVRLSDLQSGTGVALIGQTVSTITSDPLTPDRAFLAGRLDWNSGYIQTVSVGTAGIRVLATTVIPLAPGSDVRVLQVVGKRLFVGIATASAPALTRGGELRVYETRGTLEWLPAALGSIALAGVPATILPVDARDERLVVAGMVDGASSDSGFVQLVTTKAGLQAESPVAAAMPFSGGAVANVVVDAERTVLVLLADGARIAVYTLGEDNLFLWRRNDVIAPISLLSSDGTRVAAYGFAAADTKNIVQVYQAFSDSLVLRRSAALTNTAGGPSGLAVAVTGLYTLDALRITRTQWP